MDSTYRIHQQIKTEENQRIYIMANVGTGKLKSVNNSVREMSFLLDMVGCKLKRAGKIKYDVTSDRIATGLSLYFGRDVIDNKNFPYILAIMTFPLPGDDSRYFIDNGKSDTGNHPHVMAHLDNKRAKMLLFEFIFRSIYYYKASNRLRKWQCYNCGEKGYEIFLQNGTLATFDSDCNDFKLIVVDSENDIKGTVFDELIGEIVLPVCKKCEGQLGCEFEDDHNLVVDKMYFYKILSKRFQCEQEQ